MISEYVNSLVYRLPISRWLHARLSYWLELAEHFRFPHILHFASLPEMIDMVRVLDVLGATRHPTGNVKYPQRFVETRAACTKVEGLTWLKGWVSDSSLEVLHTVRWPEVSVQLSVSQSLVKLQFFFELLFCLKLVPYAINDGSLGALIIELLHNFKMKCLPALLSKACSSPSSSDE